MDVKNMKFQDFAGMDFDCECGKKHTLNIDRIVYGKDILNQAVELAQKLSPAGKIQIICDGNTYKACGYIIEEQFKEFGLNFITYIFESKHDLIPGNREIGKLLIETPNDISLMIAVGSGVINDITRQVSFKMKIPYFVVCTAASMDGYASVTSSLIIEDKKSTIDGQLPCAILADENVLKHAPDKMLKAGFGDVIGKITGLIDWKLSVAVTGEHICPFIISMVECAVAKCIASADGIINKENDAVANVFEALTIAGVTMGLYKNTRPASGAEHHLAHYWDLKAIENNEEHALHGESVGIGTVVICRLYELAKDLLPIALNCPSSEHIKSLLKRTGAKCSPIDIGLKKEYFLESIFNANILSWKYTILTFLKENYPESLEYFANVITSEIYG